ncbi:bifunctional ornithine acetyltransferase/N-acetylglutamate synthase, partial [Bacillus sp. HC-Mk]
KSAERIIGYKKEEAIGNYILEVIPTSKLLRIIRTKQIEVNYELTLENGKKIITTRIPILKEGGEVQEDEIVINVYLHLGEETGSAWGCDLSYEYVKINACYRT